MIRHLRIEGFKRFTDASFDFAPLVVLTGLNGAGKTSLIQALLLCRSAQDARHGTVPLNGGRFELDLGTAEDIHNRKSTGDIVFSLEIRHPLTCDLEFPRGSPNVWRFAVPEDAPEALYVKIEECAEPDWIAFEPDLNLPARAFTYLCAERLGPRSILSASSVTDAELEVGTHGELSAQVLAILGDRPMEHEDRLHPNRDADAAPFLKYELEAWLSEIVRPIQIETTAHADGLFTALRFGTPGSELVSAPNMGFGVSYALPVVLAGLIAQRSGLLLVENPEAHLHPAGQSRVGVFLAWLAGRGVQVVVETHSDHVLNGIRRAIGEDGYLSSDDAIIHFFGSDDDDSCVTTPLRFTASGGVSDWPPGFFDQYQIDVAALGRIRRRP
jgi:predicted ATPase